MSDNENDPLPSVQRSSRLGYSTDVDGEFGIRIEASASTIAVFSHPNHELAIFGLLQRLRPRLIYLTDGGGPERVAQTHII